MATLYTSYVSKKYKGKTYYIRGWLDYTLTETATGKSIKFSAGFQTKTRKCSMKAIKMEVSDSFGHKATGEKAWKGTSATSRIAYVSNKTFTWNKKDSVQNIKVTITGTFGKTRFSGKKVTGTLNVIIPALGKPSVSFVAERDDDTTATLSLKIDTNGVSRAVSAPTVKKDGTTISPTWYNGASAVSFPYTLNGTATLTATNTVDAMHGYDYTYSGSVGTYNFTDASSIDYVYFPEWKPDESVETSKGEPAITITGDLPDINYLTNAQIDVYMWDYTKNAFTLLPNDDGWEIEAVDSTHWKLPFALKEQYVSDPTSPNAEAQIMIKYKTYTSSAVEDKVAIFNTNRNCNFTTGLANNIFIGGCTLTDYSSRVWYSAVNNPLYMPDINYIEVGSNDTRVMGLVKVGDYLGVVKQSKSVDSSVFLVYPTSFEDETTFATKSCVSGVGALGQYCFNVLGDETLFLSPNGVMAIEPNEDEQSRVKDRSYFVNGRLLEEVDLEFAYSFVWNGLYLLSVNNHVYVLDGSQRNSWGNQKTNLVYECYFLDNVPAKCMFSYDGELWFADDSGNLCRFKKVTDEDPYSDDGEPVVAHWATIADDDNALHYLKNLTKKGCLVSLLPENGTTARVYIAKDDDIGSKTLSPVVESDPIPEGTLLPSSVYTKKKMKKYKRLQFIVEDVTASPFGIDKIIKSYTVGNYAKK